VEPDAFVAATATLVVFGLAGELAAQGNPRPGTYGIHLIDALDEISPEQVLAGAKLA